MSDISFSKLTWENLPARTTALSATNLNRIENGIADSVNGVNANSHSIAELQTRISQIANGSPAPVATVAEMTDESAVYLYTGSESGYTAGNWYYYDGSDWVSGGTYGGAVTDSTLTLDNAPANSKTVGEKVASLNTKFDEIGEVDTDTETVVTEYDTTSQGVSVLSSVACGSSKFAAKTNWDVVYLQVEEECKVYFDPGTTMSVCHAGYSTTEPALNVVPESNIGRTNSAFPMTAETAITVPAGAYAWINKYVNASSFAIYVITETQTIRVMLLDTLPLTGRMQEQVNAAIANGAVKDDIKGSVESAQALSQDANYALSQIPSYYKTSAETPASYKDAYSYLDWIASNVQTVGSFFFVTDTHWAGNARHSTHLIEYLRKRTGIRKVLFGGDILGNSATGYGFVKAGGEYLLESRRTFAQDYIPCVGDHDQNTNLVSGGTIEAQYIPWVEVERMFMPDVARIYTWCDVSEKLADYCSGDTYNEILAFFRTVYYVDDIKNNIRFIVINCGNAAEYGAINTVFGVSGMHVMRLQFDFLKDALMTTPAGRNVCVLSHKGAFDSVASRIFVDILSNFKRKKVWTNALSNSGNANMESWWSNHTTYDFTQAPDIGILFTLQGHIHTDRIVWSGFDSEDAYSRGNTYNGETLDQTKGQVPHIFTSCDAYMNRDSSAPQMELGTITEQCFDIVTVSDGHIHLTRVGAGSDRDVYVTIE